VIAAGRDVVVHKHAIERYQERVKPTLTVAEAELDLRRVLRYAEITAQMPEWLSPGDAREWVMLGDAIAFPMLDGRVLTCVTRLTAGDERREATGRARRARAARRAQPGVRKKHGPVARDERRRARERREAME
jgi:hypothetical protein